MPIVTSETLETTNARGGVRRVFRHIADDGRVFGPLVEHHASGVDAATWLANHASRLTESLRQAEIAANIAKALDGYTGPWSLVWSTGSENLAALRAVYRTATKWELITIAHVLHHQNLTNNQIDNLFGTANASQRQAVRDKLAALDAKYHDILDDTGE